jgi:hypothetical protein
MPGAWEGGGGSPVFVGVLTRELVTTHWAAGFRRLALPPGTPDPVTLAGQPFDHARNHLAQLAVEGGFQWLFFLDDDVVPPPDAFFRLAAHKQDIVSGLYFRRHIPVVACMQRERKWVTAFNMPDLIEVELVGAGCLLISTAALRKIPKPWFEWRCHRADLPEDQRTSEDFSFAMSARKAGFRVLVDTAVQCEHVGPGKARVENAGGQWQPGFVPITA